MVSRRGFILIFTLLLIFTNLPAVAAQQEDREFFAKSGHWVSGEFLEFYYSVDEPDRLFGAPITDAFPDRLRPGIMIQYFERVRMDLDPARPEGERVRLANLGSWLYDEDQQGIPVDFQDRNAMCRVFNNGKKVCYAFLQMYDRYNGPVLFGQPVSDLEYSNDRLVQYFENVRMEWRNEMPVNQRVVLSPIGRIDFDLRIGDNELTKPNIVNSDITQRELNVRAFVNRPLVTRGDKLTVYVFTHDQYLQPWTDVQVVVTLMYPDQPPDSVRPIKLTGEDGVTSVDFTINDIGPNQVVDVVVEVSVANGASGAASTWFRTWW